MTAVVSRLLISASVTNYQEITDCFLTDKLSEKTIKKIVSYLAPEEMLTTLCLSKYFHRLTIASANYYVPRSIARYMSKIDAIFFKSKNKEIPAILKKPSTQAPENLRELKTYSKNIESEAALLIKSIDTNQLNYVKSAPLFWDDFKEYIAVEKEIDANILNPTEICSKLSNQLRFNRALEIAEKITDNQNKNLGFIIIAKVLAQKVNIESALEVVKKITDNSFKIIAFSKIALISAENGDFKTAFEILDKITDDHSKNNEIKVVASILARKGYVDKALYMIEKHTDDDYKIRTLKEISGILQENGNGLRLQVEMLITDFQHKKLRTLNIKSSTAPSVCTIS